MVERGDERTRGALTLYALALMEREGPIHGYRLADRIQEITQGGWRPGPGAVYPALQRLVRRELARKAPSGRRQEYTITRAGRELLARVRARRAPARPGAPDLTALWAEVMGAPDPGSFLLVRLRSSLDALTLHLDPSRPDGTEREPLRDEAIGELERGIVRLRRLRRHRAAPVRTRRGAVA